MNQIWLVARWEFAGTVMRAGFVATALALPLVHVGLALLLAFATQTSAKPRAADKAIAVVDRSGEAQALRQLKDRRVDAVFVLADDYLASGRMRSYSHPGAGLFSFAAAEKRRERAEAMLRERLLPRDVAPAVAVRLLAPVTSVEAFTMDPATGATRSGAASPLGAVTGVFGLGLVLSLSIFMSSGLLQQAMVAERQNRVLEVLLVSVTPLRLLTGKVAGLAAAGLIQIGVYLGLVIGASPAILGMVDVPAATLGWAAACFVAGYVLYGCVMAATGALGRDTQESAQIATVWVLVGASPLFFITTFGSDQVSLPGRVLTWIPLTSPVAVLMRLGSRSIAGPEIVAALALTVLCAAAALVLSSALLRRVTIAGAR
jgi:ABC-2 type transport system permease protein